MINTPKRHKTTKVQNLWVKTYKTEREKDKSTITIGNFNTLLSLMDKKF